MTEQEFEGFESLEEAMLAAEMDDALHGGTQPIDWFKDEYRAESPTGDVYRITGPHYRDNKWAATQMVDREVGRYDSLEEAQLACAADWEKPKA